MSLSPVTGADVPETVNGVAAPVTLGNGSPLPVSVKYGSGVLPGSTGPSEDGSLEHTESYLHMENKLPDEETSSNPEEEVNGRTHRLSLNSPRTTSSSCSADDSGPGAEDVDSSLDSNEQRGTCNAKRPEMRMGREGGRGGVDSQDEDDGEKEKQDEEEDEKKTRQRKQHQGRKTDTEPSRHYSSSAPGSSTSTTSPTLLPSDDSPCPPHIMAQVWVRNVRGMQDSKSLDEISQACGGGSGARSGGRAGQSEGRRATISSALELEGTVSQEGDLTNFITKNLEQKIKMSSKPSLDCSDSDCSGPIYRSRGLSRRPADIPPIDASVLLDLQKHAQDVTHSVETMLRSLNGTIQNMTALSVGYIQTYRDSVDSLGESVDMSIKGMYTLMARCEELDRSMQPIHTLAAQIRDIKRTLDALEAICK